MTETNEINKKGKSKKDKIKGVILKLQQKNIKVMLILVLFLGVLLIASTYAWFSASLNVKIKFINLKVATDKGLFISLDGINYTDQVEINPSSVIYDLKTNYANHRNQWALNGLWTVSSGGIRTPSDSKFDIYRGQFGKYKDRERRGQRYLRTAKTYENDANVLNEFIAFDIFLKNVSGSPKRDNLYLTDHTYFEFQDDVDDELKEDMSGIMNSMRLGIVWIGETHLKTPVPVVQNLNCHNDCKSFIYEPFSKEHTEKSIKDAKIYGIDIVNGEYFPTYCVYRDGTYLDHKSGYLGSTTELDVEHFKLQETLKDEDLKEPLFTIPNGIVKARVYIWLEGQDIDSLETHSKGAPIALNIDIEKDLAGYEGF